MIISTNEMITAIYYALWQDGYEYADLERDAAHMAALAKFAKGKPHPFFAQTRQNTCEVYPYWPRAALLETAAFHVDRSNACFMDFDGLRRKIMAMPNVANEERDAYFWEWLVDFPTALCEVLECQNFKRYLAWSEKWIQEQNKDCECGLSQIERCIAAFREKYASPLKKAEILIDPIKCVYSADYHVEGETFVFSSGRFSAESIIHEFLHHVVHPVVARHQEQISQDARQYLDLDASYYAAGRLYAFEEYVVRELTALALADALPEDLSKFVQQRL